jgi:signal transduction histidine kinase
LPEKAQIDANRIDQVISKLISNASKFSPENSVIKFSLTIENNNLHIDIQDQDIGGLKCRLSKRTADLFG